jgi:hypothetical protein
MSRTGAPLTDLTSPQSTADGTNPPQLRSGSRR